MNEIVNSLDLFKTRFSRFTVRLSPERAGYCAFVEGILFTRINDIVEVQDFVEGLQELVDKKLINQAQEKALLLTAYEIPTIVGELQIRIFEPLQESKLVNIDAELERLRGTLMKKAEESPSTPPLKSLDQAEQQMSQGTEVLDPSDFQDEDEKKRKELELESERLARKMAAEDEEIYNKQNSQSEEENCQICFENLYEGKWLPLEKCPHMFHTECMKESFKININDRKFPIKCPNSECGVEVTDAEIREIVGDKAYEEYQEKAFKNYIDTNADTVSWCPTADCSHCFFYTEDDGTRFECPICKKDYCLKCRVEWHHKMTCKEHEINNTFNDDDKKFIDFVKGAKFKQCPKCRFWVEKNMGCDHMSCRCGYQFCYKCGGKYMDCECVKEAQQRLRQNQARNEQRRRKKMQAQARKAERVAAAAARTSRRSEALSSEDKATGRVARGTRSRPRK